MWIDAAIHRPGSGDAAGSVADTSELERRPTASVGVTTANPIRAGLSGPLGYLSTFRLDAGCAVQAPATPNPEDSQGGSV